MKNKYSEYTMKYAREKLKRIPLDVQITEYERIKECADKCGETVNGFIKSAIRSRMDMIDGIPEGKNGGGAKSDV